MAVRAKAKPNADRRSGRWTARLGQDDDIGFQEEPVGDTAGGDPHHTPDGEGQRALLDSTEFFLV